MKKRIALIVALLGMTLAVSGCSDEKTARKVLTSNGYKNITITGFKPFMCSDQDTFSTGFEATAPDGAHHVTGAVCSAYTKGATIRFDD